MDLEPLFLRSSAERKMIGSQIFLLLLRSARRYPRSGLQEAQIAELMLVAEEPCKYFNITYVGV